MGAIQPWHWIVLAIVVIALFGYNKLPDVTRSVGRSLRIFKTEMKGLGEDDRAREGARSEVPAAPAAPATTSAVPPAGGDPTPEQIAQAQAVLAAAARSAGSGAGESATVVPPASAAAPNGGSTNGTTDGTVHTGAVHGEGVAPASAATHGGTADADRSGATVGGAADHSAP